MSSFGGPPTKLDIQSDISGRIAITGLPNAMSGVADIRMGGGKVNGEALQGLTAHATFNGSLITADRFEANFAPGHGSGSGQFDMKTRSEERRVGEEWRSRW